MASLMRRLVGLLSDGANEGDVRLEDLLIDDESDEEEKREDEIDGERPVPGETLEYIGQDTAELDKKRYTKVIVSASVTEIEDGAFRRWESLEEVQFMEPCQVKRIGATSFSFCEALRYIKIPASVLRIEGNAFLGSDLEQFDFEDSSQLGWIGDNAFEECQSLQEVKIPVSVQTIGEGAFRSCGVLRQVEFATPSRLERISDDTFSGCEELQEIKIPSSVKSIGQRAFRECGLDRVEFQGPPQVETIGNFAFELCRQLPEIQLPLSLVRLKKGTFAYCTDLRRINFPRNLKYVGHGCFFQCSELGEITMNLASKTSFGYAAFEGCKDLKHVVSINDGDEDGLFSAGVNFSIRELKAEEPQKLLKQILDGSGRYDEFVATMFESELFVLRGLSPQLLDLITQRIIKSRRMQNCLSRKSVERAPVFVMMLDGYLNIALVSTFIFASNRFLLQQPSQGANIAILCLSGIFLLRELWQLISYGPLLYFDNSWNGIDCLRVALGVTSAVCMQTTPGGDAVWDSVRYMLMCTGIVLIGGLILFLRATVLPFAEFVGGLIAILLKLFPFLVVSSLLLFAFSYMYFTTGFDQGSATLGCVGTEEEDFCTLSGSMLTSLSFFFSGPQPTTTWQDILFGIIIVVVLLNVVIAIVSDAWAESTQMGRALFWAYRIGFLEEVESLVATIKDLFPTNITEETSSSDASRVSEQEENEASDFSGISEDESSIASPTKVPRLIQFANWIDRVGNKRIRDRVNWEAEPYDTAKENYAIYECFCSDHTFALKTFDMPLADMEKLLMMGSFERDWYWANQMEEEPINFVEEKCLEGEYIIEDSSVVVAGSLLPKRGTVLLNFALYLSFLLLGLPTCGLLWPRRVRNFLFGVEKTLEDDEQARPPRATPADIKAMESRLQMRLDSQAEAIENRVAALETKMDRLIVLLGQDR